MSPDLHHLSGAYAVDALDDAERAAFEQHLAGCADCRAEVAELSAAAQSLASLTEAGPPPSLRAAVVSGIAAVRPLPPLGADAGEPPPALVSEPASSGADETTAAQTSATEPVADGPATVPDAGADVVPIPRRRTAWFAAAAAAAVIVIGGLAWSPWSDDTGPASPMAQVVAASDARRVSATQGSMTAEVAFSRQLGKAAIDVTGLPPAPDGKTYQLWYVSPDQVMSPAGLLTTDADGHGTMLLEGDTETAAAVGLTLEPAGGSPQPTTDPMVVLTLA